MEVLDPTYGDRSDGFAPVSRPASLDGLTVGIISNGKRGTSVFFDALDRELRRRHGASEVVRVTKPNYSAPAGGEILDGAARWHALVAGIGD